MTGAAKRKGDRWERAVRDVFVAHGLNVVRCCNAGIPADVGDLIVADIVAAQAKDHQRMELAAWVDQAVAQAGRTGRLPVVVHKRRRRPAEDAYVTMPLWAFCGLLHAPAWRA